jgi:hypothetical protein
MLLPILASAASLVGGLDQFPTTMGQACSSAYESEFQRGSELAFGTHERAQGDDRLGFRRAIDGGELAITYECTNGKIRRHTISARFTDEDVARSYFASHKDALTTLLGATCQARPGIPGQGPERQPPRNYEWHTNDGVGVRIRILGNPDQPMWLVGLSAGTDIWTCGPSLTVSPNLALQRSGRFPRFGGHPDLTIRSVKWVDQVHAQPTATAWPSRLRRSA